MKKKQIGEGGKTRLVIGGRRGSPKVKDEVGNKIDGLGLIKWE